MTRSAILCTNICTRPRVSQVLTHASTMYMPYSEYDHSSSAGWLFGLTGGLFWPKPTKCWIHLTQDRHYAADHKACH